MLAHHYNHSKFLKQRYLIYLEISNVIKGDLLFLGRGLKRLPKHLASSSSFTACPNCSRGFRKPPPQLPPRRPPGGGPRTGLEPPPWDSCGKSGAVVSVTQPGAGTVLPVLRVRPCVSHCRKEGEPEHRMGCR